MNTILPYKLSSPLIPLGITLEEGLSILSSLGTPEKGKDGEETSYRVNTPEFKVAIYDKDSVVTSVWYNDPLGRIWSFGKTRKIKLYLERYGEKEDWELRMNNGWNQYYFNEKANVAMVYGIDNDVIRFNVWQSA